AVLDVIEAEQLQQNALRAGEHLKSGLAALMARHPLNGDVRGLGLFLGIELVRDHDTLEPAAVEATAVDDCMKQRGILLSTDGPLHNVIKIKPPLVFTEADADFLVAALDQVLSDADFQN
ncbi:MAG: aminotransferase class III-fold pyridoxal phosphate-dependent enzyme, partial [Anaerolineae bacterium]